MRVLHIGSFVSGDNACVACDWIARLVPCLIPRVGELRPHKLEEEAAIKAAKIFERVEDAELVSRGLCRVERPFAF